MKKLTVLCSAIALSLSAGMAMAANGGFIGPGNESSTMSKEAGKMAEMVKKATTVKQLETLKDDADVVLRGHINKMLDKERYEFEDSTGKVNLDIDDDEWNGLMITPKDKVVIIGEVDRDHGKLDIDVKQVLLDK